jgi:hypothetical protein
MVGRKSKFLPSPLHEFIIPEERTGYSPKDDFKRTGSRDKIQIFRQKRVVPDLLKKFYCFMILFLICSSNELL